MAITLNHTIVPAHDKEASAKFFAHIFGLKYEGAMGHFAPVRVNETLIGVTSNPTAEWIAGQVTEACPWNEAPKHIIRDRDAVYGHDKEHVGRTFGRHHSRRPIRRGILGTLL